MDKRKFLTISIFLVLALVLAGPYFVSARPLAATAPGLGVAGSFAVLGGSTVTNTGLSLVNGDLGVWPGLTYPGFPPGSVVPPGVIHAGDAVAQQAQSDVTTAYNALTGQACDFNLTGQDLGGLTLIPGVYCFDTSAQLTGTLTLNAQGDPNAVWVFQMGSTLTTASASSVTFINGGAGVPGCNVFWKVGSSATLGTTTNFVGNILALASITMNTGANLQGSTLARNGAVTLDTNIITKSSCESVQNSLVLAKSLTGGPVGYTGPFTIHYNCGGSFVGDKSVFVGGFATVPNIPSGTSCTVSETPPTAPTGYSFDTPTFSPSATVTIPAGSGSSITVITNNTLTRDQGYFKINKIFDPLGSGFTGTFAIKYNCGAGEVTVNLAAGGSTIVGPFNTGTSCTVSEPTLPTAPSGWTFGPPTFSTPNPQTITKGDQAGAVAVTVTNTISRDQGYFKINKIFDPLGSGFTGTFAIKYNCGAGEVTVNLAAGGSTIVGPFNTGTSCTVSEPMLPTAPSGWTFGPPTFSTPNPQTITKGDQAGAVAVTVTNTISHDQGYFKINKIFNPLGSGFTGTFAIKYNCGAGEVTVNLAAGGSTIVGPFNTGTSCTVSEPTLPTAPSGWTFGPPTFSTPNPQTITKGDQAGAVAVTVTNTISRDQGYFKINKIFNPLGSGFTGTFAIKYNCGAGEVTVNLAAGGSTIVGPFNTGTSCTVSEPTLPTAPSGWTFGPPTFSTPNPQTITKGDQAGAVAVTVTNTISRDQGYFKINKIFNPLGSGFTGTFAIKYNCGAGDVTVNLAAGGSTIVGPFNTGTSCTVSEPTLPTAPSGWTFGPPTFSTPNPQTITKGDQAGAVAVTVTNTISHDQGYFKINKIFNPLGSGFTGTFAIKYNCGAGDVTVNLAAGGSTIVGPFNTGTSCTVSEPTLPTAPSGWTFGPPTFSTPNPQTITKGDQAGAVAVTVTNTISHDQGYFKINKIFNPLSSGFTGTFAIKYNCGAGDVTVNLAAGGSTIVGPFNTGTSCTVSEPTLPTAPSGWTFGPPTFSTPNPQTITKGDQAGAVAVTVTNTISHDQGYFKINKIFNPLSSGFTGTFAIKYNCGAGDVTVNLAAGGSTIVGPFNTGTSCTVSEPTLPTAPSGWTFGPPTFSTPNPQTITKGDQAGAVAVTVTNTISHDQGYFKINKIFNPLSSGFTGTFAIKYNCGAGDVTVNLAAGGSTIVGPFNTGTSCTVSEPTLPTAPSGWTFGPPTFSTPNPQTITKGDQAGAVAVTVTNTISHDQGYFKISKVFNPLSSGFTGTFAIKYNCGAGVVTVNLAAGGSTTVGPFNTGTSCTVSEPTFPTAPSGWTFGPPTFSTPNPQTITKGNEAAAVAVTVTNTINLIPIPKIDVEKYVKNGAGVWQDADIAKGPYLNPGVNPQFKFVVTNTGNVTLTSLTLNDNVLNLSGCTIPATLAPNASFECLVTGTWAAGQHTNTATAAGIFNSVKYSDADNANYFGVVPVVSKTANGTYQEVHDWKVFKSVDVASQNAYAGQKVNFTWKINVGETTRSENHLVTGVITVVNPNPDDAMTLSLNDTLDDGAVATIGPCTGGTWSSPNLTVPKGGTATCNYSVTPKGALNELAAALPDTVTMNVHGGNNSTFDITISNDGALNGTHEGWCADPNHGIQLDKDYVANVFSSYESLPAGLVDHPENFDLVNWIINQYFVGKSAGGSLGVYSAGDVQQAIWELLQDNVGTRITYDRARVDQIKTLAAAHEGYKPSCGDLVAVILQPLDGKQLTIIQVTFASLGVDCAKSNAVLAVLNGVKFPASADIVWTATPVNPTATLDDDQNPALPKTVSADATFTYQDSYTCPTDVAIYANGPTTYTRNNKAVLTFTTGSISSTASTSVKCDASMPALTLVKTATPTTYSLVGDVIQYSYLVKNTGNVALAGPVTVSDDKTAVTCPAGGLAIDATMTCSASYSITMADIEYGLVKNTASASANGTNSNSDHETVELVKLPQIITVTTHAPEKAAYQTSFMVAASGGASGNPIVYSASGACTNVGATFTMTSSTGICTVHYNQAGNAGYEAAPEVTEVVTAENAILTVTATGVNKVYDGTTTATVTLADNRLAGDNITVSYSSAAFVTADVGTGKTVNVAGISISGADAGKYTLGNSTATTTADILPASTTIVITNAAALATDSTVGQPYLVTFSITPLHGGIPTGEVTISDGTDSCVATAGSGMCYLTSSTVGAKLIIATYAGDGNFLGSVSIAVPHTVVEAPPINFWLYLPVVIR